MIVSRQSGVRMNRIGPSTWVEQWRVSTDINHLLRTLLCTHTTIAAKDTLLHEQTDQLHTNPKGSSSIKVKVQAMNLL